MDQCDASRVAEIEKAVVEQAHCYLPKLGFQVPGVDPYKGHLFSACVVVALLVGVFLIWISGYQQGHNSALERILKERKRG